MLNLSVISIQNPTFKKFSTQNKMSAPQVSDNHYFGSSNVAFKGSYICPAKVMKYKTIAEKYSFAKLEEFFNGINIDRQKAILEVLVSSCKKENVLGEGKTHIVFSIPGTDDFVIRVLKTEDIVLGKLKKEAIPFVNHNFGQPVASLTNSGADVQFMRKVKGNSVGTPYVLLKRANKLDPNLVEKLTGQSEYIKNISTIAEVPQLTYNHLAAKIKMLKNNGYVFDIANPNNVMLQKSEMGKFPSFNIVDDLYKIEDIKKSQYDRAWNGSLEDMIYPLMDLKAGMLYCLKSKDLVNNKELLGKVKMANSVIFRKCVIAAKKAGLPLNRDKFDIPTLSQVTGIKESKIVKIFDNWDKDSMNRTIL